MEIEMSPIKYICAAAFLLSIGCESDFPSKELGLNLPKEINIAEIEKNYFSKKIEVVDISKSVSGNSFSNRAASYLRRSPDVAALKAAIKKAEASVKVTEDQKEPQFFGGITGGLDNSIKDYFGAGITLSGEKTVFDAQKTDLSISSLKIQRLLSEIQLTALVENQSLALASSYLEILEAEAGIALVEKRKQLVENNLVKLDELVVAGVLNVSDKVAGQIASVKLNSIRESQNAKKKQAWSALSRKLGSNLTFVKQSDVWELFGQKSDLNFKLEDVPSIKTSILEVQIAEFELLQAKRSVAPVIKLTGSLVQPLDTTDQNENVRLGINIQTPLFKQRHLKNLVEAETAAVDFAKNQLEKSIQDTVISGDILRSALSSSEQTRELLKKSVALAQQEILYIERQIKVGQASVNQLINAHSQLLDTELRLSAARFEYFQAHLRILELHGRLTKHLNIKL